MFAKLDVYRRREAVERPGELGLFPPVPKDAGDVRLITPHHASPGLELAQRPSSSPWINILRRGGEYLRRTPIREPAA